MTRPDGIPTLSVLVPARNRPMELATLLTMIDECSEDNIEFVISDNSDLELGVKSQNPNCRIVRPNRVLNMTDHWNFILEKSNGKFVTFLGDDDAFIPSELSLLAKKLEDIESDIVWYPRASYQWPRGKSSGNFYQEIRLRPRNSIEQQRFAVLKLKYGGMPLPYHAALVHSRVIENFKRDNPNESFISSRVPDQNSGAKILFLATTQFEYDRTVFVSGASPTSNGGLTEWGPKHPRSQEFKDLDLNPPSNWLPRINLPIGFIWDYEAVNESLRQLGISHEVSDRRVCFRAIVDSRDSILQFRVSRELWPNLVFTPILALITAIFYQLLARVGVILVVRYLSIIYRVASNRSLLRSLKGREDMNTTRTMVDYIEKAKIVDSRKPFIIVRGKSFS
jgi:glycosyltransferase involved in cell wall biosynthesis